VSVEMTVTSDHLPHPRNPFSDPADAGPVIACVDEGPGGCAVARVTDTLARRLRLPVLLATVQPVTSGERGAVGPSPRVVRRGRSLLARAARELDQPADRRVVFGEPAERLIALADREAAELVVTPARDHGPMKTPLGSVYLALAGAGPCPVVVVPRDLETPSAADGPVICGIDGSAGSLAAAGVAKELARRSDTQLRLIHVTADDGLVAERLADVAARLSAQLIVTAARGAGAVGPVLLGSVSSRLAATTTRPLVIVPVAAPFCAAP
jgi:nucleotide-binding universal stress UspA family protein